MSRGIFFAALTALVLGTIGCGGGAKKYDVSGTVKYDGQEVGEGQITFTPEDKTIGPEGGAIKDGKYTVKVREGKYKVSIQANRTVPGKKGPMGEPFVEQYIPDKYNDKTTLSADVSSGKSDQNFDLAK